MSNVHKWFRESLEIERRRKEKKSAPKIVVKKKKVRRRRAPYNPRETTDGVVDYGAPVVQCARCGGWHDSYCNICGEAITDCTKHHKYNQIHRDLVKARVEEFMREERNRNKSIKNARKEEKENKDTSENENKILFM